MRLEKFREKLAAENLDGFLVTQSDNRRYLSGFTGSNGVLIITPERQALATDSRGWHCARVPASGQAAAPELHSCAA